MNNKARAVALAIIVVLTVIGLYLLQQSFHTDPQKHGLFSLFYFFGTVGCLAAVVMFVIAGVRYEVEHWRKRRTDRVSVYLGHSGYPRHGERRS